MTQTYPARIVVDADLSCEAPFYTRGARGSDSRGHGDSSPQAREGHHDTSECEDRSPGFFWAGNPAPFIFFFGYVSTKEPVAQMARITVSLISVEAI
ncbi:unnamed protein product [Penicillium nalgiovense]|nr:unnamed protein product [Penicillium nalgiovense]